MINVKYSIRSDYSADMYEIRRDGVLLGRWSIPRAFGEESVRKQEDARVAMIRELETLGVPFSRHTDGSFKFEDIDGVAVSYG